MGRHLLNMDLSAGITSVGVGFAIIGNPVLAVISDLVVSLAHTSPTIKINELIVSNFFGVPDRLIRVLLASIEHQLFLQSLKVLNFLLSPHFV